ncbi:hypothetical protein DPMN_012985 [Dreissena polymorpha]|uniref:Uncharacterized protein n=1 Tax=Dreissena polymorpha TaxID=45954 RepID=A0A9D4N715_DREPO|nr:hypothetical protein DPMN_012985 [Dreissena polymorpha]
MGSERDGPAISTRELGSPTRSARPPLHPHSARIRPAFRPRELVTRPAQQGPRDQP